MGSDRWSVEPAALKAWGFARSEPPIVFACMFWQLNECNEILIYDTIVLLRQRYFGMVCDDEWRTSLIII